MNNVILTNILKQYEKKRLLAEKDLENRKNKLYSENIRLEEIDTELSKIGIETAKSLIMSNNSKVLEDLNKKVNILKTEKSEILKKLNLPNDYLLPNYSCKQCNDTGYITKNYNSTMCNCLKQEIFNIEYNKSNIANLETQNFDKTGMIVTATYDDGTTEEVTDYTIEDGNNLTVGKENITISYTEDGITKTTIRHLLY